MKTVGLSGKSGTGKSYNAMELCGRLGIEGMIDDGLFICENRIVAGVSAKKQPTKIGAVKVALFTEEDHRKSVMDAINKIKPKTILVIGTSENMIQQIVKRLHLPFPYRIIKIEDITTLDDRIKARKLRSESGTHVIPAPTFQVKRQFSGYFLDPMKRIRGGAGNLRSVMTEKTVVRPTYSYLGGYEISDKVIIDIVHHVTKINGGVSQVLWTTFNNDPEAGMYVRIILQMKYGTKIRKTAIAIQKGVYNAIIHMTALNVTSVDVEVRNLKRI